MHDRKDSSMSSVVDFELYVDSVKLNRYKWSVVMDRYRMIYSCVVVTSSLAAHLESGAHDVRFITVSYV